MIKKILIIIVLIILAILLVFILNQSKEGKSFLPAKIKLNNQE